MARRSIAGIKKKNGRPRKKIDWGQFEKLCYMHCTEAEIAAFFECAISTLHRAVKWRYGDTFANIQAQKKCLGKANLRRRMMEKIDKADTAMLIFMSKQWLGFSDKSETKVEVPQGLTLAYKI